MKRKFIQVAVVMAILAVLVMPSVALAESPSTFSTVAYGQNLGSFGETFQRHNFDAVGLNWVFWNNGSAIIYSTSSDTVSWSTPSIFSSFSNLDSGYSEGSSFSLWYDESANFVDIAYLNVSGTNKAIYYDRFTPVSDGTIVKGTIQVAVAGSATHNYSTPSICVNQNDLPFIAYMSENASTSELKAYVATSKVGAGVWTSATNSTISVSNTLVNNSLQESSYVSVIPVSVGNVSIQYAYGIVSDMMGQNYAKYNVTSDRWSYTVMATPFGNDVDSVAYPWLHSEVNYPVLGNNDAVYFIQTAENATGVTKLYVNYYNSSGYLNPEEIIAVGEWTAVLSIRGTNLLVGTGIDANIPNTIYSVLYHTDTEVHDAFTQVHAVLALDDYIMAGYQYSGGDVGILYSPYNIALADYIIGYGCYGCTPTPTPSVVPASVSTMATMIAIVLGAVLIFILLGYAFSEIKNNGFSEMVGVTFGGILGIIVLESIIIAVF